MYVLQISRLPLKKQKKSYKLDLYHRLNTVLKRFKKAFKIFKTTKPLVLIRRYHVLKLVVATPRLTVDEAIAKTGSKKLGSFLSRVIDLIPFGWSTLVNEKVREPFQVDDWVVYRSDRSLLVPSALFKVVKIISGRISARFYCKLNDRTLYTCTNSNVFMLKEDIVKACVFVVDDDKESPVYIYAENYAHSKLLLSRLSWHTGHNKVTTFVNLTVKTFYQAIMIAEADDIPAIQKWKKELSIS
jgi:hypothetical protein